MQPNAIAAVRPIVYILFAEAGRADDVFRPRTGTQSHQRPCSATSLKWFDDVPSAYLTGGAHVAFPAFLVRKFHGYFRALISCINASSGDIRPSTRRNV